MVDEEPEPEEAVAEPEVPDTIDEKIDKLKLSLQAGEMGPAAFDAE